MSWLVVGVNTMSWPTLDTKIVFKGQELLLRPRTEKNSQSIVLFCKYPFTTEDGLVLIRRFFSALAWCTGHPVEETNAVNASVPVNIGRGHSSYAGSIGFKPDHLPETDNPKAMLALAFYRESLNVNSIPYKFLGFFKIINILYAHGSSQKAWIRSVLPKIHNPSARERVSVIEGQGEDVADYLYVSGRCAVAHAYSEPLIDPERPEDSIRLEKDLIVIKALSEYLIENEFGVKSRKTIWREHLYELDGFRIFLGDEQLAVIKKGDEVPLDLAPTLPMLSIRLRDQEVLSTLEALVPEIIEINNGRVLLRCISSKNNNILVRLCLNFADERLEFDPEKIMGIRDDGSPEVIDAYIERLRLLRGLVLNGQLEIWDDEQKKLLGRTDPYIPFNVDLGVTLKNLEQMSLELQQMKELRFKEEQNDCNEIFSINVNEI